MGPVSLHMRAPAQVELPHLLTQSSMSLQPSNVFLPPSSAWGSTQAWLCYTKPWEAMDHTAGDMASPAAGSSRFSLASPTPTATMSCKRKQSERAQPHTEPPAPTAHPSLAGCRVVGWAGLCVQCPWAPDAVAVFSRWDQRGPFGPGGKDHHSDRGCNATAQDSSSVTASTVQTTPSLSCAVPFPNFPLPQDISFGTSLTPLPEAHVAPEANQG